MQAIVFYISYFFLKLFSYLPLNVLYLIADVFYFPIYYVLRYRRGVVRTNLMNSFPNLSKSEIIAIEKKFYHHFSDSFIETIKLMHISNAEMKQRIKFFNLDLLEKYLQDGQSGIMLMGHYGNWEWIPSVTRWISPSITLAQIYRPLSNKYFDQFFLKLRSRFGSISIPKNDTLRSILQMKKEGLTSLTGFIADQTPSPTNIHYWTNFLNQDTPCLTGVEKIARKTGFIVFYCDIIKVKRGHYEGYVKLISDEPKKSAEFEITEKYMRELEQSILRAPENWLWTHKRWKHKRKN